MRKNGYKKLLAGMLCFALLLTNDAATAISVRAAEINPAGKEQPAVVLSEEEHDAEDSAQPGEENSEQTGAENSGEKTGDFESGSAEDSPENPAGKDKLGESETPGEGDENTEKLGDENGGGTSEETSKNDSEKTNESSDDEEENAEGTETEVSKEENADGDGEESEETVGEEYVLTTSADDIASGVVDEEYGHITWRIDANGKLTVNGTGDLPGDHARWMPWDDNRLSIKTAEINVSGMTTASCLFLGCENLTTINLDNFNTVTVTDMQGMFSGCKSLAHIDLNQLNTANVQDMDNMFSGCDSLTFIDLSILNTSAVTDMTAMFSECDNLSNINLNGCDTHNVVSFYYMFNECNSLKSIDLSGLDTSNVTNMMGMFQGCDNLSDVNLKGLDTHNVTNMWEMFSGCSNLNSIDLDGLDTHNVSKMGYMFNNCSSLTHINLNALNTSNVIYMSYMFSGCVNLVDINLNQLDISNLTNTTSMFNSCRSLTYIDLRGLNTSSIKGMNSMFADCKSLSRIDLGELNLGNVYSMDSLFSGCSSLTSIDLGGLNLSNVVHMDSLFAWCTNLKTIYTPRYVTQCCPLPTLVHDIWYRSDGTIVTELPKNLSYSVALGKNYIPEELYLSGYSNEVFWEIDRDGVLTLSGSGDWISDENGLPPWVKHADRIKKATVSLSGTTDASSMFSGCTNLESANLCGFDMSQVVTTTNIFNRCTSLDLIYTPTKLTCSTALPTNSSTDIWYRSDKSTLSELPPNLDYSIAIGKNHFPEEIPTSVTNCIGGSIIGKGVSFGRVSMVYQGEPVKNKRVRWKFDGYDIDYKLATTDEDGYFMMESPLFSYRATEENDYTLQAAVSYFTGKTWLPASEKYTMEVKVEPLAISQKWQLKSEKSIELGLGAGVGVEVGPAKMKASLGEIGTAASSGGTLSLSHSYENGKRKLSLSQTISKDVALKSSVGPAASVDFGAVTGKIKLVNVKGSAAVGDSITYGLDINEYDPANRNHLLQVGKFVATSQMYTSGNIFLKQALILLGFEDYDIHGYGVNSSLSSGVSALGVGISDSDKEEIGFSADVLSAGYDRAYSTSFLENGYDNTNKYELEIASDTKQGILNFNLNGNKNKIEGFSLASFAAGPQNTGISVKTDPSGNLIKVEYDDSTYTSWGVPFYSDTNTNEISFSVNDPDTLQELKDTKNLQNIVNTKSEVFFPESYITDTWEDICEVTDSLDFDVSQKEKSMAKIPISLGLNLVVDASAGVELSGSSETSYVTQKGITENDSLYVTAEMQNTEEDIENAKMNLSEIFTAPLNAIDSKIREFVVEKTGKVIGGVKIDGAWVGEPLDRGVDWSVHILSLKKRNARTAASTQSFAINTYRNTLYNAEETPGVSMTVGDPYLIYVTDENETEVPDFTDHPLELKLDYDNTSLSAAGITSDQTSALAIYMFSEEKCGYLYLGGKIDTENQQVSVSITKPGQYILAVDNLPPTIYDIYVSDTSAKPTITAFFSELSGFSQFSMKIDDIEYVNKITLNQYLDESSGSFVYKVKQPLSVGEHILSFTATDNRGNTTEPPITFTFIVDQESFDIGDVLPEDMPQDGKIPDGLWVATISDSDYTGKAIKPTPHVYDSNTRLKAGTDYTVTYKNNTKANDASNVNIAPTITVTGKGNYTGKETVTFKILPIELTEFNMTVADMTKIYNQKVQMPVPSITVNGRKLKYKTDFFVSYPDINYRDIGTYRMVVTGTGNYTGEQTLTFNITDKTLLSKVSVAKIPNQEYTGEALTPAPVIKYKKAVLVEHEDYELEYRDNTAIGKATVILKGKGNYAGQKTVSFQITGGSLNRAKVSGLVSPVIYTGNEIRQNCILTMKVNGEDVTLQSGKDYTVTYQKNSSAGTAKVVFKGINGYTGTLQKTYKITPYDIRQDSGNHIAYTEDIVCIYVKGGSRPEPDLYFKGVLLKKGIDYTLNYKNNNAVQGSKTPMVVVKGKGSFKNTVEIPFKIQAQNLANMTLAPCDKVYKNKANIYQITPKLLDTNGKALQASKDFDKKSITYTYANDVILEDGTVKKAGYTVEETDIIPANTQICITLTSGSGNLYEGTFTGTYRIATADLKSAKVSIPAQTYTGSEIKLDKTQVTVKLSKMILSPDDYEIISYANNIKKGNASVTIVGKGNYGGTKTVKFKIKAKGFLWWWR